MAESTSKARISIMASIGMLASIAAAMQAPAQAGVCGQAPVTARGEESRFMWIAQTKARANWRRKVVPLPGSGRTSATGRGPKTPKSAVSPGPRYGLHLYRSALHAIARCRLAIAP